MVLRKYEKNPVLSPDPTMGEKTTFNPAAIAQNGIICLFYRTQAQWYGTSEIRLAISKDGINFIKLYIPVLWPQFEWEIPGGCEDPRVVRIGNKYYMTYTAYDGINARLALATSDNLFSTWKKCGILFPNWPWTKAGGIIPEKINGEYWMYFGEGFIWVARSKDLIHWKTKREWVVLRPRSGKFDSVLVEVGPPPIVTEDEIILIYNAKDENNIYRVGWAIFSKDDPTRLIARSDRPILEPETPWEKGVLGHKRIGQTPNVVFAEALVQFKGKLYLYYGASDTYICLAIADKLSDLLAT